MMPDDHAIEREAVRELRGAILRYLATSYRFHTSAGAACVYSSNHRNAPADPATGCPRDIN